MHIISYATIAQSQFPMVVKYNTVSLRHKHNPETLIIHINQCIHIVLAFTSNARQSIFHLKYCFQQKFYFSKISFLKILFFEKFVLFYLILFFKIFLNSLFTADRSTLLFTDTVHHTVTVTVHRYCSPVLFSSCNTFFPAKTACCNTQQCIAIQTSLAKPLAIQFLQYNALPTSSPTIHSIVL